MERDGGSLQVRHPYPGPAEGERVSVHVDGGVVFADSGLAR
jgi:hypothetical protein